MKETIIITLVFILSIEFSTYCQSNIHSTRIREYHRILNTSNNNFERMRILKDIADEYLLWNKLDSSFKYYNLSIELADIVNQYNYQYDLRLFLAGKYSYYKRNEDAVKILNQAFEVCVKNNRTEDANKIFELLKRYQPLLGDEQNALIEKRKEFLSELSDKLDKSRIQIQNSSPNNTDLKNSLSEISKLKDSLEKNQNSFINLKELLIKTQENLNYLTILNQKNEKKIIQKDSLIKALKNRQIVFIILFLIISVLFILLIIKNRRVNKQRKILFKKNKEIIEKSNELNSQKEELTSTLEYLNKTQKQLIQKAQMASLGQLIAGIAHEINTPLGAINSSIETVLSASEKNRQNLPLLFAKLSDEQFGLLMSLLEEGKENLNKYVSTSEERKIKSDLQKLLIQNNINNSSFISGMLCDIGIWNLSNKYLPLLNNEHIDMIIKTAYYANIQFKNGFIIREAVKKASRIVFALKYYSFTSKTEEMVLIDIIQSIETVLTLYHNQLKHRIKVEKKFDKLPEILCYPNEISQVWTNLLINSIHAIKEDGEICIIGQNKKDHVELTFRDNGIGIPDQVKEHIFDPFFTTKPAGEGTGLGLDIIKKIIEKHNGEISFESEVGKGTSFTIKLPIEN